jgi:hypothetical protein
MTTSLKAAIKKTSEVGEHIKAVVGKLDFRGDAKTILLSAYFDIGLELHESIEKLTANGLHGGASALVRTLTETFFRALWVNGCATASQIVEIGNKDDFQFPKTLMAEIDSTYGSSGFFTQLKQDNWKAMCSYTHSGLLQLSRRVRPDGNIDPQYSDGEIMEVLRFSTTVLLLFAISFLKSARHNAEGVDMENYALAFMSAP